MNLPPLVIPATSQASTSTGITHDSGYGLDNEHEQTFESIQSYEENVIDDELWKVQVVDSDLSALERMTLMTSADSSITEVDLNQLHPPRSHQKNW